MKLASLRGPRDGRLVVVDTALRWALDVSDVAPTLQAALDDWAVLAPRLRERAQHLATGTASGALPFRAEDCAAPLPRAHQWVDGSAYVNHMELVRRARGAELPPSYWHEPLVYQGGSDDLCGARDPLWAVDVAHGIDLEAEVAVITDDVPLGTSVAQAEAHIQLLMLVNDVSLRNLIPAELAKGFGFYQSKPATAFSPVAVTPDELGAHWHAGKVHLPLRTWVNGEWLGAPECGVDMTFSFHDLLAFVTRTRRLGAGTVVGSGTVSNYDRSRGSCCIAEQRMLEILAYGDARTPFLQFGDTLRIEMLDAAGGSIFGAIQQQVMADSRGPPGWAQAGG